MILALVLLAVGVCITGYKLYESKQQLKKYSPIIDLAKKINDQENTLAQKKLQAEEFQEQLLFKAEKEIKERENILAQTNQEINILQKQLQELTKEVNLLNEDSNLLASGFYKSKYDFSHSDKYKDKLEEIRDKQKEMIKNKLAIVCGREWTVDGSRAEGKKMTERTIRLGLSAFNVQCDNEILRVKFDNIDRAEEKINKIRENVDKLLEPNHCKVTTEFLKLKIQELHIAYEYQEKLQREKEEQKAIREQAREEEKARKEIERIQAEAEKEEVKYSAALEKARVDLIDKSEKDREKFEAKIIELEAKLKEAQENKERAKSQAELTKRGHVYIISNIGSFGENVYKIGMTRRLDPQDRVDELGDASVPFDYDVHAMIHTEDAPGLENKLHQYFSERRLNKINLRREFFKVTLEEIEHACKNHHKTEFKVTLLAEAKEWRQSIALTPQEKNAA